MQVQHSINKDTVICISISANPGNFGAAFHNSGYSLLGLNWIYISRKVETALQLKAAIDSVRALKIKGCSVSMPHKERVIKYLDELDPVAKRIGAVNTIKQQNDGTLKGYNTDYYGAKKVLAEILKEGQEVLMLGAGGVGKAIGLALKDLGANLTIANRTYKKAKELANTLKARAIPWEKIYSQKGYLLINATSVGMNNPDAMIVDEEIISNFAVIKDVVIYPAQTRLIREAKRQGKKTIPGTLMCVYQAAEQFKIYTGYEAPQVLILKTLSNLKNSAHKNKLNFIIDVDGVMTTGQFLYSANGKAYKVFGPHDADGLKMIRDKVNIIFITSDKLGFPISQKRIGDMGYPIEIVSEQERYNYIKEKYGFENTIFMGDGIFDATVLKASKFGIAPKNARKEAREAADFVTSSNSAEGAVCDACLEIKKRLLKERNNVS